MQLPEAELKDSADGNKFELHSKALTGPTAALLPITLVAHKEEVKTRWLSEIRSFATDQVALQEHATDDLRIDPNHVQQVDVQVLKLPQRIDSADPDCGIRPSDFAKDHFLTKSQRRVDDKCETVASEEKTSLEQVKNVVVQESSSTSEKKLLHSVEVESLSVEQRQEVTGEKHSCPTPLEESPNKVQKVSEKVSRIPVKTTIEKPKDEPAVTNDNAEEKKRQAEEKERQIEEEETRKRIEEIKRKAEERRKSKDEDEAERRRLEDLRILEEKRQEEEEFAKRQEDLTKQQELRKLKESEEERERRSQEEAERKVQLKNEENLRKIQEAGAIDIRVVESVKTEKAVVVEVATTVATTTVTASKGEDQTSAIKPDQAAGGASDGKQTASSADQKAPGNVREVPLRKIACKPIEDPDPPDRKPPHRNSDGSHPPTVIPDFNPPPALVYHTTFEVSLHKEPLPPPPVPPIITHKVVVHNESLEQRTEEFLRGHCEFDAINYSLSSAQSKIKNIKSTFGKSNQETDLAEDTVRKAKSGEFQSIVHPPVPLADLHPKPRPYEVVEIVTQPGECDKLPEELQRKYDITKELLLTKKEQKMSSAKSSSYHSHEGNGFAFHFPIYTYLPFCSMR